MGTYKDFTSFEVLYDKVKNHYTNIVSFSEDEKRKIDADFANELKPANTINQLVLITISSIIMVVFFSAGMKAWLTLGSYLSYLNEYVKKLPPDSINYNNVLISSGMGALLFYILAFNIVTKISDNSAGSVKYKLDKKNPIYIPYIITSIYVIILGCIWLCLINFHKYPNELIFAIRVLFTIPIVLTTTVCSAIALVLITVKLIKSNREVAERNPRLYISFVLLNLLEDIKSVDSFTLMNRVTYEDIISSLVRISKQLRYYPIGRYKNIIIINEDDNIRKSANTFDQLIIDFSSTNILPNEFKDTLVRFLNIFLSGNLQEIPKIEEVVKLNEPSKKVKIYHYIYTVIFLSMPVLLVIMLTYLFHIKLDDYSQSLLKILYLIWAIVCVITSPILKSHENKEFLEDIIKTIFGKK